MKYKKAKIEPVLTVKDFDAEYEPVPKTYSIHEAKTNFSKLVKRAEAGETIYIGSRGKAAVALKAVNENEINAEKRRKFIGCMKGKIVLHEGWDGWTDEELADMFGEDILL